MLQKCTGGVIEEKSCAKARIEYCQHCDVTSELVEWIGMVHAVHLKDLVKADMLSKEHFPETEVQTCTVE